VEPTIFADLDRTSTIAWEEVFGPVLSVIAHQDEGEAARPANDSRYGLGGTVWSADPAHALEVARRVRAGTSG
jgi:aldehyde dehydrogenase (NAD+)